VEGSRGESETHELQQVAFLLLVFGSGWALLWMDGVVVMMGVLRVWCGVCDVWDGMGRLANSVRRVMMADVPTVGLSSFPLSSPCILTTRSDC
jgi:hypothetical protein